ncbi:MAG: putative CRISPR-associated protein [candidate division WOR-3 bacterium]
MKEFHIISSGVSLLLNAQKKGILYSVGFSDESYWQEILNNPQEIENLYEFLKGSPKENSAELNTFLRVVENKNPQDIEVYLFGTKTASNELCRRVLERFLKDKGYTIYTPYEVSGYFWESAKFNEDCAKDEFQKGIAELLDRLIYLAKKKIEEGYYVYFNPTGGFKAHVIATALAGFLLNCDIYYMNEEFNRVVFLPPLFYLPKGREIKLLEILKDKMPRSGSHYKELIKTYPEEVERLEIYQLVQREKDERGKDFRIRITDKGLLILEKIKQLDI